MRLDVALYRLSLQLYVEPYRLDEVDMVVVLMLQLQRVQMLLQRVQMHVLMFAREGFGLAATTGE